MTLVRPMITGRQINRRQLLNLGVAGGAALGIGTLLRATPDHAGLPSMAVGPHDHPAMAADMRGMPGPQNGMSHSLMAKAQALISPNSGGLNPFVDALPIPPVLTGQSSYTVTMEQFQHQFHRDLGPATVWGYGGHYPGPTFEVEAGSLTKVRWYNNLPPKHLLPVDPTYHGATGNPEVRSVVHLHGGHTPSASDGIPDTWFVPGQSVEYTYPNNHQSTMLWYHDHAMGITRLNVYAGLTGMYLIRDATERALNLPSGPYEIPLLIQDRSLNPNGTLYYPPPAVPRAPEFFGDVGVVNGKVLPYLEVEPRKYRFRVVNGSNSRFYHLALSTGQAFHQIGTDGGLLDAPVQVTGVLLAPAERADLIIDFASYAGARVVLTNDSPAPYPGGGAPAIPQLMQFRVRVGSVGNNAILPAQLTSSGPQLYPGAHANLTESAATKVRDIVFREYDDASGAPLRLLFNGAYWSDPITEKPVVNSTEIWQLVNMTPDTHPVHIHLVQFHILDRQPFDTAHYNATGKLAFTGLRKKPDANEAGWKDVVRSNPGEVTRIIMRFEDYTGKYVYHCHILEHEENDMMRPFEVVL